MPKNITKYSLLVSCPGDIKTELGIIRDKVDDFNRVFGKSNNVMVDIKHWSKDSYPQSGGKPQDLLNKQFVKECDLAVAIFWTRFGTPTDEYGSGTEEEIELLISAGKQVFLYFSDIPKSPSERNDEQYKQIKEFKNRYKDRGIYFDYKNIDEFETDFLNHLSLHFLEILKNIDENKNENEPKLVINEARKDKIGSQDAELQQSDYTSMQFKDDIRDDIKKLYAQINGMKLSMVNKEEEKNDLDNVMGSMLKNIASVTQQASGMLIDAEKVSIDISTQETIRNYSEKIGIKMDDAFFFVGNLEIEVNSKYNLSIFGSNAKASLFGIEDEKKKYSLIKQLNKEILNINAFYIFLKGLDNLYYIELMLSNCGNRYDEDIDIEIRINKGCICKSEELPIPDGSIIDDGQRYIYSDSLYGLKDKFFAKDYSSGEVFLPQPSLFTPDIQMMLYGKSYDDLKKEVRIDIEILFDDYKWYQDDHDDILQIKMGYLKHGSNMLFPCRLFFKEIPKYLKYEIKSKHQADTTKGQLNIVGMHSNR